ncbi:hypothetical protein BZ17_4229 (plasmid) [Yersinia pseudotuberculosis IP 32953]|nr:hypothetical protein BZ20_4178 [Yersinia pseudotuberculosis]AJJ53107.1 hypothetical protein BZ17_4229 [Yersinia pseudotuberculosis IP 32953]AJJ65287.1 hypothetical protein BZ16_4170 [Yersinia pseudotuberculosis PB1/+]AJK18604.1 hypothetical protein BZ19_4221 [Yersinia pseudotuberculosis str. PA3606]
MLQIRLYHREVPPYNQHILRVGLYGCLAKIERPHLRILAINDNHLVVKRFETVDSSDRNAGIDQQIHPVVDHKIRTPS